MKVLQIVLILTGALFGTGSSATAAEPQETFVLGPLGPGGEPVPAFLVELLKLEPAEQPAFSKAYHDGARRFAAAMESGLLKVEKRHEKLTLYYRVDVPAMERMAADIRAEMRRVLDPESRSELDQHYAKQVLLQMTSFSFAKLAPAPTGMAKIRDSLFGTPNLKVEIEWAGVGVPAWFSWGIEGGEGNSSWRRSGGRRNSYTDLEGMFFVPILREHLTKEGYSLPPLKN